MKVIIAGGRDLYWFHYDIAHVVSDSGFDVTEVVSGTARGIDRAGEEWSMVNHVPCRRFPADWGLGKKAGMLRNRQMAEYSDALIAVWDGQSRGTKNMIEEMEKLGKPVYVHIVGG